MKSSNHFICFHFGQHLSIARICFNSDKIMKILSIIIVLGIAAFGLFDTAFSLSTSAKRSIEVPEVAVGGHWKTRTQWKGNWVKNWIPKTIYIPVWKRVWTPVSINEWVPYVPAHH